MKKLALLILIAFASLAVMPGQSLTIGSNLFTNPEEFQIWDKGMGEKSK